MKNPRWLFAASLILASAAAHASCGSAFCSVNTDWNMQGVWTDAGLRADLRYEFIRQDQPMSGSSKVAVGQIPRDHDEVLTLNRNWLASLDYTFDEHWGVSAALPLGDRSHVHIPNDGSGDPAEIWKFSKPGDLRLLGRYQREIEHSTEPGVAYWGVNFGMKLPTGARDVTNAEGERAERTLQPGTGTTDALAGVFYSRASGQSAWFAQVLLQQALNQREDYKPGRRIVADLGYRYAATERLGLMLQLNGLARNRDSGAQAEPEDSGGRSIYLSPGASYRLSDSMQLYGFVQLPLYQYVNGVQLTAKASALIGISARF